MAVKCWYNSNISIKSEQINASELKNEIETIANKNNKIIHNISFCCVMKSIIIMEFLFHSWTYLKTYWQSTFVCFGLDRHNLEAKFRICSFTTSCCERKRVQPVEI